jgi:LysM repeat protein
MRMKLKNPFRQIRLKATAKRAAAEDYDDEAAPPTMRLSSAMLVVLALHVVAIGGIWAFGRVKDGRSAEPPLAPRAAALPAPAAEVPERRGTSAARPEPGAVEPAAEARRAAPAAALAEPKRAAVKEVERPAAAGSAGDAADAGLYVVVKGDNPYTIAKKLHVRYSDLLAVNGIVDAKKLQIGQKLKIPGKPGAEVAGK